MLGDPIGYIDQEGTNGKPINLGNGNSVRIDKPHVSGQQTHAHFKTPKGEGVVNKDGSQSHKNKGSLDNMNKKIKKYLEKHGFKLRCIACSILPPDIQDELQELVSPEDKEILWSDYMSEGDIPEEYAEIDLKREKEGC